VRTAGTPITSEYPGRFEAFVSIKKEPGEIPERSRRCESCSFSMLATARSAREGARKISGSVRRLAALEAHNIRERRSVCE